MPVNLFFLYRSVLTLGELYKGIAKLSDDTRKKIYRDWIEEDLSKRFENRILPVEGSPVFGENCSANPNPAGLNFP